MTTPAVATAPVPRTGGRTSQGSMAVARTGGRTQQGTGAGRQVRPGPRPRLSRQPRPAGSTSGRKRSGPDARLTRRTPSGTGTAYQNVILAEFVAAVLLVAVTPFAAGKNKAGLSPYAPTDMFRLVAITVVYLILALISGANQGAARVSAWVGALILVASTLDRGAQIAKDLQLFGGGVGAAAAQGPGHGQAPGPPGQAGGPVPPGGQR